MKFSNPFIHYLLGRFEKSNFYALVKGIHAHGFLKEKRYGKSKNSMKK
jgi:hypothetical protein